MLPQPRPQVLTISDAAAVLKKDGSQTPYGDLAKIALLGMGKAVTINGVLVVKEG